MTQLLYIHGGMTFKSHDDYITYLKEREIQIGSNPIWPETLEKAFPDMQVIKPRMPLKENAKYEEWKIHLERHFPFLEDDIILVGWSLGGIFLAKYLSENTFPKKIKSVFIIAAPFDDTIAGEDLAGGFELTDDLQNLTKENVHIWFSEDDPVVPKEHADKFRKHAPNADIRIMKDKNGHFIVEKFPELIDAIKQS
ncbi:MAG: alpha/beta hydrolase [Nanoarchaeota archaeon]